MFDPVIVIGPGRSGTSLVAGLLHEMGYFMGYELSELNPGNPKGTFEDPEIMKANRELERRFPGILDDILDQRDAMYWPWGFKDPFTAHRLDYYGERYPQAKYIYCKRPYEDVMDSLVRASNGAKHDTKDKLFKERVAKCEAFIKDHASLTIKFDDMVTDPEPQIDRLLKFLVHPTSNLMKKKLIDFVIRREK